MQQLSLSTWTYIALIIILAALAAVNAFLPQGQFTPLPTDQQTLPSKPRVALVSAGTMLVLYGGLGFMGLLLARKLGFPEIWDPAVSNQQRFLTPALAGAGLGVFFIVADFLFRRLHALGPLPHPPFPTSIVASATAAIGEEVIFRLFFIPFWVWLVSTAILKGRWQGQVFWIVAAVSALAFAVGHLPSVMFTLGLTQVSQVPPALLGEIILLNGVFSLIAAYLFRRFGFLAAVGVHFWTDVVWHVIWGLFAR